METLLQFLEEERAHGIYKTQSSQRQVLAFKEMHERITNKLVWLFVWMDVCVCVSLLSLPEESMLYLLSFSERERRVRGAGKKALKSGCV